MKKVIVALVLLISVNAMAQDQAVKDLQSQAGRTIAKDAADTSKKTWKRGGLYSFNVAQASLSNWAAGGDDFSLAVNSLLSLYAFHQKGKNSWDNTFDFNVGYVNTTSLGTRKNDDRFDFLSKYGRSISKKWSVGALFNLRSQLFKGYSYAGGTKSLSSTFMAPGYVLLSLGMDYKPNKNLSVFLSPLTARWVIVSDPTLSAKGAYGVTPGKKSNLEFGAFASVNYLKEINKNVTFKSRLDLFSNYRRKPQNVDLYMSNILNLKLSKVLAATWGVDFIYDDDVRLFGDTKTSPGLQIKSLVGIGLLVKF
jgi:Protein of unknown function (DUF3078)